MGYKNHQTGYPADLLESRAMVEKGNFALIPQNGLVKNVLPGFEGCAVTILSSPKMGATFVDYIVEMEPGGSVSQGFGGDGVESFVYVLAGSVQAGAGEDFSALSAGGYLYCPPTQKLFLKNTSSKDAELFLYKRRYRDAGCGLPSVVRGNLEELTPIHYEDMDNVLLYDLLPKSLEYDMNMHLLSFQPGASHGYIETHVQEHGALVLSGQGMYNLDNRWMPVKKGDYIFMGAYSLQAAYGVGTEPFSYLYSKDCNRDEPI